MLLHPAAPNILLLHIMTCCSCIIPVYNYWWNNDCFRYVRPGGYPVGTPYNESFPGDFHLRRNFKHHVVSVTNNQSSLLVLQAPQSGPWFIASFLPKKSSEKITQKVNLRKKYNWSFKRNLYFMAPFEGVKKYFKNKEVNIIY